MPFLRPMPVVGRRCYELRVRDEGRSWRLLLRFDPDAIVIAMVFQEDHASYSAKSSARVRQSAPVIRPFQRGGTMKPDKRRRIEAAGWRVGTVQEFLGLSEVESAFIEIKLDLAANLRRTRLRMGISQVALAKRLKSSQSRVAKMEAADPTVSLDLLIRAHLALGARRSEIAKAVA